VLGVHLDDGDDLEVVVGQQLLVLGHLRSLQKLLEDRLVLLRPLSPQLLDDEPRRVASPSQGKWGGGFTVRRSHWEDLQRGVGIVRTRRSGGWFQREAS
jgi:hypothetical protein